MTNTIAVGKLLGALAVMAGLAYVGWTAANWRSDSITYKAKAARVEQDLKTERNTLKEVQDANDRKDADNKRIAAAAATAAAERDRLRGTLAKARAQLASAPTPAVVEYANAVSVVFEQCTKEYLRVAAAADGHAADAANLTATWQAIAGVK